MNIDKICEQLTIDEKIRLLGGVGDWHTYDCNGKIPSIMMTDGPHGIRKLEQEKVGDIETSKPATCFPTASAIACSWNPAIVKKMGEAIAKEAKKEQISIVLGCGINIKRTPLCGRNFEYFSEDPYLISEMAVPVISGISVEPHGVVVVEAGAGDILETDRRHAAGGLDGVHALLHRPRRVVHHWRAADLDNALHRVVEVADEPRPDSVFRFQQILLQRPERLQRSCRHNPEEECLSRRAS